MAERIKLGGLWMNTSKDGVKYLTGKLSPTVKILIFENGYKQQGDNQPTHVMYLAPVETDATQQREQASSGFFGDVPSAGDFGGGDPTDAYEPDPQQRPARSAAQPPARSNYPRPASPQQPSRPLNAATTNTRPAGNAPVNRRPEPPQSAEDPSDFDDPFAE